ncbi:class I SAM-dependent methyltransferase [Marinivivus vitaminiproducens]|uniref:class I SAM-dependent methyltransferase n=1 Tax=Marinivivus vitaminiproducens TaxID=3035935 RepID=UPI0027AB2E4A|nr:class I SAM-dependent methyltransferase [Geminicoccaceae bacterium SCSIO 64248]
MAQNIYDDPAFFQGYAMLARSVEGLDGAAEWPSLRAMLPPMRGLRVVDLGCGFGWFARWARAGGAASVLGLDISERMLARARSMTDDAAIAYVRADLDHLDLPAGLFDLAFSSLVLHYLADLDGLLQQVHRALVPGSRFVFSAEHPLFTAPTRAAWAVDADGNKAWPVDAYLVEGERTTDWLAPGVIKRHRTFATYVNLLRRHGFALSHVEEWGPTDAQVVEHPEWADERRRPTFMLVAAERL